MKTHKESTLLLDGLQAVWDEQSRRIDQVIAASDTKAVTSVKSRPLLPIRLRLLYGYVAISFVIMACSVYWAILIPSIAYNTPTLVTSMIVEGILVLILSWGLYAIIHLIIYNPARVGILPRSFSEPSKGKESPTVRSRTDRLDIRISMRLIRHAAAACITAVTALTVVSCTTTGTDGYTITQNHHARTAAVESVSNVLNKI